MRPPKTSPWGRVRDHVDLGCGILYLFADAGEGAVLPIRNAARSLPREQIKAGIRQGALLFFSDVVPLLDVASKHATEQAIFYLQQHRSLRRAQARIQSYFAVQSLQLCPPPVSGRQPQKLLNGIYAIYRRDGGLDELLVHCDVAALLLSGMAKDIGGAPCQYYLHYPYPNLAVVLYELSFLPIFHALAPPRSRMERLLAKNFPAYLLAKRAGRW